MNLKNELSYRYNLQKFFASLHEYLQAGEELILEEIATGAEDAWLNSLIATVNPDHVRYHRVDEIIAAAGADFTLLSYEQKAERLSFSLPDSKAIEEQLASLPEDIAKVIDPELSESTLALTVYRGSFRWSFRG